MKHRVKMGVFFLLSAALLVTPFLLKMSFAQVNQAALTPLAGEYQCRTHYLNLTPGESTFVIEPSPSVLGTITLDGKGRYTTRENTGTYVYSPASGFTFTRGSLAGWPTILDSYDLGLELRLAASQDEAPSAEGGSKGEHICRLEVPGFTAATAPDGTADSTEVGTALNGGFAGTLTFEDGMINDLDLATGKLTPRFAGSHPHRTANGETVFINSHGAVVIVDPEGLVNSTFPTDDNGSDLEYPIFSKDGVLIAYTLQSPYDETHVVVRKYDGTKVADFTNMVDPSWTPDGRLVMVSNTQYQDAPIGLFISDAALATTTRIDPNLDEAYEPAVSPDGGTVAFIYHRQLWLMDIDGSNPRQLGSFEDWVHSPTWSPDGKALVIYLSEYSNLVIVSLDGQVTELKSEDGKSIQIRGNQISWN